MGSVAVHLPMLLRILLLLTALSTLLPAQTGEEEAEHARRKLEALQAGGDVKGEEKGVPDDALEKMTPEQRLNHNIRHGAANLCSFVATPKPAKLMPGQTGMLVVTAILKANAVLPAPPPFELLSGAQQGMVTLGSPAFRPAEPGKLNGFYRGRPVYDNWAIFEVPITMSPAAEIGRSMPVSLEMKFDLYDAGAGQPIGRFIDRVAANIEVGHAADPAAQLGGAAARQQSTAATPPQGGTVSSDAEGVVQRPPAPGRTVTPAAPSSTPPAPHSPDPGAGLPAESAQPLAVGEEGEGLPVPLLVAGAAVLAALLLLLLRRRG